MQDNIYALGIGDGATVATQAVMKSTSEWSGLAAAGNLDSRSIMLNSSVSAGSGGRINELVISGEKCPLPVWLATETEDRAACMFTEYWKKQNNCRELYFSGEGADKIFAPFPISFSSRINSENIAQVRLTLGVKEFSIKLFEKMWKYIGAARRHRSFGLKDLRYYRNPVDRGAVKREIVHNGITRIWYELVPEKAKGKLPRTPPRQGRGKGLKGAAAVVFSARGTVSHRFLCKRHLFLIKNGNFPTFLPPIRKKGLYLQIYLNRIQLYHRGLNNTHAILYNNV